ncbi:MAG: TetR/AcrR family transcriptional regulator [Clostridiales bacterium]|nr:TetR/AcrR family transcriptional regulator [Clostridiales bacterium]
MAELSTREKLILAGMEEIRSYGLQGFSLRRVASACGVSCAAPYKHFTDKQEMFTAMVDYVNEKWRERLRARLELHKPVEETIADIAVDNVAFLCENPHFKSVLIIKETGLDRPYAGAAVGISIPLKRLFIIYGRKHGLGREELRSRIFIVRSLVYGSAIILGSDEGPHEARTEELRAAILAALR